MLNFGDDVIVSADTQKLEWKRNKSVNVKPKHTEKKCYPYTCWQVTYTFW